MKFNTPDGGFYLNMTWWVAVIIVAVFVIIVTAIALIISAKLTVKRKFVCPKCDYSFKPLWTKALFSRKMAENLKFLECPKCNKKSWCVLHHDEL